MDDHKITRVEEKVVHLEKVQKMQQDSIIDICQTMKTLKDTTDSFIRDIHKDISAIRIELARPQGISWSVAIVVNALSVISTALIVYLVTHY